MMIKMGSLADVSTKDTRKGTAKDSSASNQLKSFKSKSTDEPMVVMAIHPN
jgi:hypothetical protein